MAVNRTKTCVRVCTFFSIFISAIRLLWSLEVHEKDDSDDESDATARGSGRGGGAVGGAGGSVVGRLLIRICTEVKCAKVVASNLAALLRKSGVLKVAICKSSISGSQKAHSSDHLTENKRRFQRKQNRQALAYFLRVDFTKAISGTLKDLTEQQQRQVLISLTRDVQIRSGEEGMLLSRDEMHLLCDDHHCGGGSPLLELCKRAKLVDAIFFTHERDKRDELARLWKASGTWNLPSHEIHSYFGVEVASYFCFLNHYLRYLVPMSIFGCVWHILETFMEIRDIWYVACLPLAVCIWSSVFIGSWSREKTSLAEQWAPSSRQNKVMTLVRQTSPHHGNIVRSSNSTGAVDRVEQWVPSWLRHFISLLGTLVILGIVVAADSNLLALKTSTDAWLVDVTSSAVNKSTIERLLWAHSPGITKAVLIACFGNFFTLATRILTNFEGHKHESDRKGSRVLKLCAFHFVSNFLYLYWYAFVEGDIDKLRSSLMTVLVVSFTLQNSMEILLPWLKHRVLLLREFRRQKSEDGESVLTISKLYEDIHRDQYPGTFDDYLELFVQYGRVALFMPVFPIGAILALLNNFIEQRGDSYKMLYEQNPMFPAVDGRDTTADVWFVAFSVLSYLAIASNVALLGMDRDSTLDGYQSPLHPFFPERFHDLVGTLAILFVLEHALILMKTIIAYYWATTDRPTSQLATEENAPHQPLFTHISETNASTPAALSASVVKFASDRSNEEQARLKAPGEAAVVAEVLRVLSTRGVSQHYTSPASLKGDILACIRPLTSRIRQAERERDEAFAFASEHISPEVLCKLSRKND